MAAPPPESPRPHATRSPHLVSILILAGLILVLLLPTLPPFSSPSRLGGDIVAQFLPSKIFLKEAVGQGHLPLWNPLTFSGVPFLANPQRSAIFYLDTPLFLMAPPEKVFPWDQFAHLCLAAVGMYLLLFYYTRNRAAALFAGIAFAFNGFFLHRILMGHFPWMAVSAYLPLCLLFLERMLEERDTYRGFGWAVGAAIGYALGFLTGYPETSFMIALVLALRFVWHLAGELRAGEWAMMRPLLLRGMLTVALVGGLIAVQLLPTLEWIGQTARVQTAYDETRTRAFPPVNLVTLVLPEMLGSIATRNAMLGALAGEMAAYSGILTLVLAFSALYLGADRRAAFFLVLALLAVVLALGPYTPLYRLFYALPGFKQVAAPLRYIFLWSFAVPALGGLTLSCLLSRTYDRARLRRLLILLSIATVSALLLTEGYLLLREKILGGFTRMIEAKYAEDAARRLAKLPEFYAMQVRSLMVLTVLLGISGGIYAAFLRRPSLTAETRRVFAGACLALLLVDLGYFNHKCITAIPPTPPPSSNNGAFGYLRREDQTAYRIMPLPDANMEPERNLPVGVRSILGYDPLIDRDYLQLLLTLEGKPRDEIDIRAPQLANYASPLAARTGVKYVLSREPLADPTLTEVYDGGDDPDGVRVYRTSRFDPMAYLSYQAVTVKEATEVLARMNRGEGGFFDGRVFLSGLEAQTYASGPDEFRQAEKVQKYEVLGPNRLRIEATATRHTLLVVNEVYFPGWKAYVDGKEAPLLRANYILRAIPLPAGRHVVEVVYEPVSFRIGAIVSGVTLAVTLLLAFLLWRRGALPSQTTGRKRPA
jgi:hypothetical protein